MMLVIAQYLQHVGSRLVYISPQKSTRVLRDQSVLWNLYIVRDFLGDLGLAPCFGYAY